MNGIDIPHTFHVVPDNFGIPSDGIIGKDFIRHHKCTLDYESKTIIFSYDNYQIKLPIHDGCEDDTVVIPPRSEVFRLFHLSHFTEPQFLGAREIGANVFMANTIVHSKRAIIRVINVSDDYKTITNEISNTQNLSDFYVYTMNNVPKNDTRKEILRKTFERNTPEFIRTGLTELCLTYSDVFALETDRMTQNNFYRQKLRVSDNTPTYCKNYRLPRCQKEEINRQVENLLKNNLIEASQSPYNAPLILVPKKQNSQKWRMCVDYKLLNRKLIADKHPLPRIDEILDGLGKAKYFSILDLFSGFHQIKLEKESRELTAFSTERGSFQWKVLPFGLSVAPNSFCRMMSLAFAGLPAEQAFLYMDDIIVIGSSEKAHLKNLENIFAICRKHNLKINPEKCRFFRHEVTFLGHTCTQDGLQPDISKMETIKKYPRPSDREAAKRFSAFMNYYRRFIGNFAEKIAPINRLTRNSVDFYWGEECERSFQTLKSELVSPKILKYPNFEKTFIVTVDASKSACGAVLSQAYGDDDHPICFISRSFQKGELNKSTIMKELLAIHYAITYLRPYLYGTKFIVRTDHKPLVFLYNVKNPASKLTQIRLDLEEFDFTIEHVAGTANVVADALSRIHIDDLKTMRIDEANLFVTTRSMTRKQSVNDDCDGDEQTLTQLGDSHIYEETCLKRLKNVHEIKIHLNENSEGLRNAKISIHLGKKVIHEVHIKNIMLPNKLVTIEQFLREILMKLQCSADELEVTKMKLAMNDELFEHVTKEDFVTGANQVLKKLTIVLIKDQSLVSDRNEQINLIKYFHENELVGGHFGINQVLEKLRKSYYWPNMIQDVKEYIRNCKKCTTNKVKPSTKSEMVITPTPLKPFDTMIIDTVGPLRGTGTNKYALTMMCDLSKYLITTAMPNKEANTVAKAIFDNCILIYGPMRSIRTDLGSEYKNSVVEELCKMLKIRHNFSTAYHHESLGTIERNHRVLNEYLRTYLTDNDDWETHLKHYTFCYNISYNASMNHTYTPYELVFGKSCNLPRGLTGRIEPIYNYDNYIKILKHFLQKTHLAVQELIEKSKKRNKQIYDKNKTETTIEPNDLILIKREPYDKFKPIYDGPHRVKYVDDMNNIIYDKDGKLAKIHKNRTILHKNTLN